MTLAIGIVCREGAILLSDSLTMSFRPDGVIESSLTDALKIAYLERAGITYVRSGACDGRPLADFDATDFPGAARRLFDQVATQRTEVPTAALVGATGLDGGEPSRAELARLNAHVLIVADTRRPGLGLLTDDRETWLESGIVVDGAAHGWWPEVAGRWPVPTTLRGAVATAAAIAEAFKRYVYQPVDWLCERGLSRTRSAPICPPWNLLAVTPRGVEKWSQ